LWPFVIFTIQLALRVRSVDAIAALQEFDEVNKRWIGNNQTAVKFQQGVAAGDDDDFFPDEEDSFDEDDYISSTSPERKHSFRQQHRSSRMRTIYMQGSSNDEVRR
jgi:hypothetical protein